MASALFLPERSMIDKYITLSPEQTDGLLNHWRSASIKLFLRLSSASAGVSFTGSVTIRRAAFPLEVRFACGEGRELGLSLLDFELLRTSAEEPRRWLACNTPGCRFVLEVEDGRDPEGINLDDFDLASTQEQ
jgi:hypothetical protein